MRIPGALLRKSVSHGAHALPLAVMFLLAAYVAGVAAEPRTGPPPMPAGLEVLYDAENDLLSVQARHAVLGRVLHEISDKAGVTIESSKKELLTERISIEITRVPLERALTRLLEPYNSAFFYSSAAPKHTITSPPTPRLDKVVLLSKKQPGPLAPQAAEPQPNQSADQSAPRNRERAEAELLRLLSDRSSRVRHGAMVALKDLAPEKAVQPLMDLLQDRSEDTQARIWAASLLGEIGDQRAVDLLMRVFNESDRGIQPAAASGLARIGGERSMRFLLQVFSGNDRNLHRTAAMALAFHGDDQAKAALAQAIREGHVLVDAIPRDVIDRLARRR